MREEGARLGNGVMNVLDSKPGKFIAKMKKASTTRARKCRSLAVISRKQDVSLSPAMVWSCLSPATSPYQGPSWAEMYEAKFGSGFRRLQATQNAKQHQMQKQDDMFCSVDTVKETSLSKKPPTFTHKMRKAPITRAKTCRSLAVISQKQDVSPSPAMVWSCLSPATSPYQGPSWVEMYEAKFESGFRRLQTTQDAKQHQIQKQDEDPVCEQKGEISCSVNTIKELARKTDYAMCMVSKTTSDKKSSKFTPIRKVSTTRARKCCSLSVIARKQDVSPSPAMVRSCLLPATSPYQGPSWAEMYETKYGSGFKKIKPTKDVNQHQVQKQDKDPVCEEKEEVVCSVDTVKEGARRTDDGMNRVAETTLDSKPSNTPKMKKALTTRVRKCRSLAVMSRKQDISPSPAIVWSCLSPATSPYQGPSLVEMYEAKFGSGFRRQTIQDAKRNQIANHDGHPVCEQSAVEKDDISTECADESPSNKSWIENMLGKSWKTKLAIAGGVVAIVGIGWVAAKKYRS